jgi:hypothetical protein
VWGGGACGKRVQGLKTKNNYKKGKSYKKEVEIIEKGDAGRVEAEIANSVPFMADVRRQLVFLTRRKKGREREMDQLYRSI